MKQLSTKMCQITLNHHIASNKNKTTRTTNKTKEVKYEYNYQEERAARLEKNEKRKSSVEESGKALKKTRHTKREYLDK